MFQNLLLGLALEKRAPKLRVTSAATLRKHLVRSAGDRTLCTVENGFNDFFFSLNDLSPFNCSLNLFNFLNHHCG